MRIGAADSSETVATTYKLQSVTGSKSTYFSGSRPHEEINTDSKVETKCILMCGPRAQPSCHQTNTFMGKQFPTAPHVSDRHLGQTEDKPDNVNIVEILQNDNSAPQQRNLYSELVFTQTYRNK